MSAMNYFIAGDAYPASLAEPNVSDVYNETPEVDDEATVTVTNTGTEDLVLTLESNDFVGLAADMTTVPPGDVATLTLTILEVPENTLSVPVSYTTNELGSPTRSITQWFDTAEPATPRTVTVIGGVEAVVTYDTGATPTSETNGVAVYADAADVSITITLNAGFVLTSVKIDGSAVDLDSLTETSYVVVIEDISANHTVIISYAAE